MSTLYLQWPVRCGWWWSWRNLCNIELFNAVVQMRYRRIVWHLRISLVHRLPGMTCHGQLWDRGYVHLHEWTLEGFYGCVVFLLPLGSFKLNFLSCFLSLVPLLQVGCRACSKEKAYLVVIWDGVAAAVVAIKFIFLAEPYRLWKTGMFMSISFESVPKYFFDHSFESRIAWI